MTFNAKSDHRGIQRPSNSSLIAWVVFVVGAAYFLLGAAFSKSPESGPTVNPNHLEPRFPWFDQIIGFQIALPPVDSFGERIELGSDYLLVSIPADCCGSAWYFEALRQVKDCPIAIIALETSTEFEQHVKGIPHLRLITNVDFSLPLKEFAERSPQIAWVSNDVAIAVPGPSESFSDFLSRIERGEL